VTVPEHPGSEKESFRKTSIDLRDCIHWMNMLGQTMMSVSVTWFIILSWVVILVMHFLPSEFLDIICLTNIEHSSAKPGMNNSYSLSLPETRVVPGVKWNIYFCSYGKKGLQSRNISGQFDSCHFSSKKYDNYYFRSEKRLFNKSNFVFPNGPVTLFTNLINKHIVPRHNQPDIGRIW
jgi:hypothetical protein